jgi:anhydro-N-acetylmuramic acid kinase
MMRPLALGDKRSLTILGINSGTSSDGIDMAVVRLPLDQSAQIKFLHGTSQKYPAAVRETVLKLADGKGCSLDTVVQVDSLLGQTFGNAAAAYLKKLRAMKITVDAIASHGQTVRHLPKKVRLAGRQVHGTLQLGSLSTIAALTGKVTVGDFRQADIALGNEGAPITVAAVARLFGHPKQSRLIVNVGGMANYFYLPASVKHDRIQAADCGPGNVLSDLLSQYLYDERFDRNGRHARAGKVSQRLLSTLTGMSFFRNSTASTGRELFGQQLAEKVISDGKRMRLAPEDLMATVIELTAYGICRKVRPLCDKDQSLNNLYLTGGGAFNSLLRERIGSRLDGVTVGSVAEIGMDPTMTEASSYAVIGAACLRSQPMPTRFDGQRQRSLPILGLIAQPPV